MPIPCAEKFDLQLFEVDEGERLLQNGQTEETINIKNAFCQIEAVKYQNIDLDGTGMKLKMYKLTVPLAGGARFFTEPRGLQETLSIIKYLNRLIDLFLRGIHTGSA